MLSTLAVADTGISNILVESLFLLFLVMQTVALLYMKETKAPEAHRIKIVTSYP